MTNIYSSLKIFHFKEKLDSLSHDVAEIQAPIHIRIKPTSVCHHNCSYCAYRSEALQLGKDMQIPDYIPLSKMLEIVDDLAEMGVQAVTFSGGGEPLCYSGLAEVFRKLISHGIKFACLTNGSRLESDVADLLAEHGTWVRVSIDGYDEQSYMDYRGVAKGEFNRVMQNIEAFAQRKGRCFLGVSFIVDKKNADHVYAFLKQLKALGVQTVKISPCIISNSGEENNSYHRSIFERVKKQITKAIDDFACESFEIYDAYHELDEKFEKTYDWCPYVQVLPVIGADMRVYTCQDKAYNLATGALGSIADQRFKDFWYANKDVFFSVNPSIHCNHHCVANGKNKQILNYLTADKEHLAFV